MRHRATDRLVLAIAAILLLASLAFATFQN
jgi:hypothetical protein